MKAKLSLSILWPTWSWGELNRNIDYLSSILTNKLHNILPKWCQTKRHTFLCIGIKYVNGYLVFTSSKARLLALKLTSSLFFVKPPAPTLKVNISKCMSISSTYLHLHLKHLLIWSLSVRHIVSSQAEYLQGLTRSLYINEKKDCILYVFFK